MGARKRSVDVPRQPSLIGRIQRSKIPAKRKELIGSVRVVLRVIVSLRLRSATVVPKSLCIRSNSWRSACVPLFHCH